MDILAHLVPRRTSACRGQCSATGGDVRPRRRAGSLCQRANRPTGDPGDVTGLRAAVRTLASPEEAVAMGVRGRERCREFRLACDGAKTSHPVRRTPQVSRWPARPSASHADPVLDLYCGVQRIRRRTVAQSRCTSKLPNARPSIAVLREQLTNELAEWGLRADDTGNPAVLSARRTMRPSSSNLPIRAGCR